MSLEEKINANVQKTVDRIEELGFFNVETTITVSDSISDFLSTKNRIILSEEILTCIKNTLKAIAED